MMNSLDYIKYQIIPPCFYLLTEQVVAGIFQQPISLTAAFLPVGSNLKKIFLNLW